MKRLLLLGLAVAALLGSGSPAPPSTTVATKALPPVVGIASRPDGKPILAWFDPLSLKALPGRKAPLGLHRGAWSFSGDRSVLAIAGKTTRREAELRFIDARRMRVLGDLRLSAFGEAWLLAWVRPDRLLAVIGGEQGTQLVVVDPRARKVIRRAELPGPVWSSASTRVPGGLVLLLGAHGAFEPARVAVVDADGGVRVATVSQIPIGIVLDEQGESHAAETRHPGLAVDPSGRAFLVGAGAPMAQIDLATLEVSYHEVSEPVSLLGRLRDWLEPAAEAKALSGPWRYARWVGDGLIAVTGSDNSAWRDAQGKEQYRARAAGLRLIDTSTWTVRTLNADTSSFQAGSGLIFAMGGSWDSSTDTREGVGIVAYDVGGRERYRLHSGEDAWLNVAGSLGYIYGDESERVEIVDLAAGEVLARLDRGSREEWPYLLAANGSVP